MDEGLPHPLEALVVEEAGDETGADEHAGR